MGFLFGGKMKRTIEKNLNIAFSELRHYAETGEASESKKTRILEFEKKQEKKKRKAVVTR